MRDYLPSILATMFWLGFGRRSSDGDNPNPEHEFLSIGATPASPPAESSTLAHRSVRAGAPWRSADDARGRVAMRGERRQLTMDYGRRKETMR